MTKKKRSAPSIESTPRRRIPAIIIAAFSVLAGLGLIVVLSQLRSGNDSPANPNDGSSSPARRLSYEIVNVYPHDPGAFLQGLLWHDGYLYESTGREGQSSLRKVEIETGRVVKKTDLPADLFGEGVALVGNRLIQLTWTTGRGFVYDIETFRVIREFRYDTEGWGLTYDGEHLIMTDGSDQLIYLDPETFQPVRRVSVTMNGRPLFKLNELEYIEGEIWSNVWFTDLIVRIDPGSGRVTSYLDLRDLLPSRSRLGGEDVLNGIAYDPDGKRIFVSGKLWPKLFEISVK